MTAGIITFKEPRALAGLAAKLPALFLPNKQVRIPGHVNNDSGEM